MFFACVGLKSNVIETEFKSVIDDRIEKICKEKNVEVAYAFQSLR